MLWARVGEIVLVDSGHDVVNNALDVNNVRPVFQERTIFGVVWAMGFGRVNDFVPPVFGFP